MAMFLVELHRSGPRWDSSLPLEQQSNFAAHAAFMDGLVEEGFIVLGGPLADEFRVVESITPWTIRLDGRERRLV
jgi:hypothetical protein